MNEGKRLIKTTGIIAIGNLSTKVVAFLLLPLYTSILTTEEYGVVDYIISISTFCVPFISFLMDEAIFRFLIDCKNDDERKSVVSSSIIIILAGSVMFIIIGTPIMIFLKYKYTIYMVLYIITAVFTQMTSALLRGIGKTTQYVMISVAVSITAVLMNVFFIAIIRIGLVGMLISYIIAHSIVPIFFQLKYKLWRYFDFKSCKRVQIKEMFKYSLPLIPNKISWSIINLSDRIVIMNVINSSASGLYAAAHKFPNLVDTMYGFFYQSWKESSARALNESGTDIFYNTIYKHLRNFMFSLVVCFTAFMPIIFNLLINRSYNEAIVYVPPLVLATYFSNISGFYGGIFTAYKDTKIMGTTTVIAALISLLLHLLLINFIGLYAATFASLVANIVAYIYRRVKVKRYIRLHSDVKMSIVSVIVISVIWLIFYFGDNVFYIVGYVVAIVYSVTINRGIIIQIFDMIKKKVKKS